MCTNSKTGTNNYKAKSCVELQGRISRRDSWSVTSGMDKALNRRSMSENYVRRFTSYVTR